VYGEREKQIWAQLLDNVLECKTTISFVALHYSKLTFSKVTSFQEPQTIIQYLSQMITHYF
jgi:hypothetical protein